MSRSVQQVDGGGPGHAQASQERAVVQAMRPATARGPAAPPSEKTRDHVMAWPPSGLWDRGETARAQAPGPCAVRERVEPLASKRYRWGHAPWGAVWLGWPVGALHGGAGRGPRAVKA